MHCANTTEEFIIQYCHAKQIEFTLLKCMPLQPLQHMPGHLAGIAFKGRMLLMHTAVHWHADNRQIQ
jgi:hypothetical protein